MTVGGAGAPLLLLHGTDGPTTVTFRRLTAPLAAARELVLPTRRGWPAPDGTVGGGSPAFDADQEDLLELLADRGSAHLLGYSYGCLGALLAAPDASRILSLTLLEPPVFSLAPEDAAVRAVVAAQARLADSGSSGLSDEEYPAAYRAALGQPARGAPSRLTRVGAAVVHAMRTQRPATDCILDPRRLATVAVPTAVVTGGWSPAFELVADRLAELIPGGERRVLAGCGHELPAAGDPLSDWLERRLARLDREREVATNRTP